MHTHLLRAPVAGLLLAAAVTGQSTPISLNYNWNGIVHAGEQGNPDDPNGYRAISDRGLNFQNGVPTGPVVNQYVFVTAANTLDMVHLGNRNTVDGGNRAFDAQPDGDDIGIQPAWLPNVDQTGPQTTTLSTPYAITGTTRASFLIQISNGGGSMDVIFGYTDGSTSTHTISAGDWFGGPYAGADATDSGNPGAGLHIDERTIDLSGEAGKTCNSVSFANRSNGNAGYAIFAGKFDSPPPVRRINQIALNYNWNGIVHTGEQGVPDDPNGFRSISDRATNFVGGVPADPILDQYSLVDQANTLDIVYLGNRNTVAGGQFAFQNVANGDNVGTQPTWLTNVDQQSGSQVTSLPNPILLDGASRASFIYQISDGGGSFDVTLTFGSAGPLTTTLTGGDWFGGNIPGCDSVDFANFGALLNVTESSIDLSTYAGDTLTSIAFSNPSNLGAGYAILGANVGGCIACGQPGGPQVLGGGNSATTLMSPSNGNLGCPIEWQISNGVPNNQGWFLIGFPTTQPIPLGNFIPFCSGSINLGDFLDYAITLDGTGSGSISFDMPVDPSFCGNMIIGQFGQFDPGLFQCPVKISDAIGIVIGD
ncbi:MAG: hypothetical protein O3C51_08665 [Planctomycetota bacterium]|nr:hypothetical protein [Planctomycetota bacterium]